LVERMALTFVPHLRCRAPRSMALRSNGTPWSAP